MISIPSSGITKYKFNMLDIYLFLVLWYVFLASSSLVLRPFSSLVWVVFAGVSVIFYRNFDTKISKYSGLFLLSLCAIIISGISSKFSMATITLSGKLVVYFIVCTNISKNKPAREVFVKIGEVFLIGHMILIYCQLLFPAFFIDTIFQLIPQDAQALVFSRVRNGIAIGFTTQTGVAGFWMSMGFGLMICKLFMKTKGNRILLIIMSALFACACLLTEKRSFALLSLILMILMIYVTAGRKGKYSRVILALVVLLGGFFLLSTIFPALNGVIDKNTQYLNSDDLLNGRTTIYKNAIDILQTNYLVGTGYGTFSQVYLNLYGYALDAHNSYLQSIVELGLIGVVPFWAPFIYGFIETRRILKYQIYAQHDDNKLIIYFSYYVQALILLWALSGNPFVDDTFLFIFIWMQTNAIAILRELRSAEINESWSSNITLCP